jgi:hypothetical protein
MTARPTPSPRPITCAQALTPVVLLVCTPEGAFTEDTRTGATRPVSLGSTKVTTSDEHRMPEPQHLADTARSVPPAPTSVPIVPTLVTSGGSGACFFIPSGGANEIGLLTVREG